MIYERSMPFYAMPGHANTGVSQRLRNRHGRLFDIFIIRYIVLLGRLFLERASCCYLLHAAWRTSAASARAKTCCIDAAGHLSRFLMRFDAISGDACDIDFHFFLIFDDIA